MSEEKSSNKQLISDFIKVQNKKKEGIIVDKNHLPKIERVSTGSYKIDDILGGGMPLGRIVELIGSESSGKSTIALQVVANAQRKGLLCGYIDMEHAIDPTYAEALGVSMDDWIFSQPSHGEEALELASDMLKSKLFSVIVIDSVATLVPEAEVSGNIGDSKMGLHARLMSQGLRMMNPMTIPSNCLVLFINQWRDKIGVMYGDPKVPTGGNSLKFYASIRIELAQMNAASIEKDSNKEAISKGVRVKTLKNKTYPPFKTCEVKVSFGKGIDAEDEIVEMAEKKGIIKRAGSWFSYNDTKLGQGADSVKEILEDNPELKEEILSQF